MSKGVIASVLIAVNSVAKRHFGAAKIVRVHRDFRGRQWCPKDGQQGAGGEKMKPMTKVKFKNPGK